MRGEPREGGPLLFCWAGCHTGAEAGGGKPTSQSGIGGGAMSSIEQNVDKSACARNVADLQLDYAVKENGKPQW